MLCKVMQCNGRCLVFSKTANTSTALDCAPTYHLFDTAPTAIRKLGREIIKTSAYVTTLIESRQIRTGASYRDLGTGQVQVHTYGREI